MSLHFLLKLSPAIYIYVLGAAMKISLRHIFLVIGLTTLPLSYVLFAYNLSIVLLGFSYVAILVAIVGIIKRDSVKLATTLLLISGIVILGTIVSKRRLKVYSYGNLISANENILAMANEILMAKKGDVTFSSNLFRSDEKFSNEEIDVLRAVEKRLNPRFIQKDSRTIYYCTDGVMDSDYGLWYFYTNNTPDNFLHIKGRWYYD